MSKAPGRGSSRNKASAYRFGCIQVVRVGLGDAAHGPGVPRAPAQPGRRDNRTVGIADCHRLDERLFDRVRVRAGEPKRLLNGGVTLGLVRTSCGRSRKVPMPRLRPSSRWRTANSNTVPHETIGRLPPSRRRSVD